ncbi:hypothetical protein [Glycomyces buryatensis]|uniref:DUF3558 domain-containing protein n=1 Tax=Glycomyces buryatensis TaxID=2570927 RepID=A0A4S8QC86_9ACTN|nr:hypothetical protein [Glycomyces buryatensis]THV40485.1 hypothetical protein FAB82_14525 [Glycomyces buryatensis]
MTVPSNQPQVASRSRKRLFALLAVGLGLVALAAVYLVVQLIRDDTPDIEADFSSATCEDFDLAEFETFSAGEVELSKADGGKFPDSEARQLYCKYTSDSGITLTIGAGIGITTDTADDPASVLDEGRRFWEIDPSHTVEDFDNGVLAGYTLSYETEPGQVFNLHGAGDQLFIGVFLRSELGEFDTADALDLAEALAGQAFERFEAYA